MRFSKPGFSSFELVTEELGLIPGIGYYLTGRFENYNDSGLDEYFVMKLNLDGTLAIMKTIGSHELGQLYIGNDGIYLLGKTTSPLPFTGNEANALLAKFDPELNLQWAKVFYGEAFEYSKSTLSIAQDGTLALGYSTFGAFPVILAKLDAAGNILWQKGYPLYEPQIDALSDGSLLLATQYHFDETGEVFVQTIVAKTDPSGGIQNCETFPTCLKSVEISFNLGAFQADTFEIDDLGTLELDKEPAQFGFSEFCDIPPPPSPEFVIPDTLCVGDSVRTSGANNALAHRVRWRLIGVGVDSVQFDSTIFGYRFQNPGEFTLQQTVWFLGCGYSSERTITVLEPLEARIRPEGVVCEPPPLNLTVSSNRPLTDYIWSTGQRNPELSVSQSGIYSVAVSDGYCLDADTVSISFLLKAQIYLPNTFSPNGDGINDVFFPQGTDFVPIRLWVYDRWGGLAALEEGPEARWDGKNAQQGTYVYVLEYLHTKTGEKERIEGTVSNRSRAVQMAVLR
ncbi:MAG: gliding motility-associated C-terminal domain-containing protein [Saprospirales bacterium]|nr:gliding motility-associated C-terminal domain-containing protein [Saprospirales bacterium]